MFHFLVWYYVVSSHDDGQKIKSEAMIEEPERGRPECGGGTADKRCKRLQKLGKTPGSRSQDTGYLCSIASSHYLWCARVSVWLSRREAGPL